MRLTAINKNFIYTLSLAAGMLLPLAFAPFAVAPLAIIALSALFFCWTRGVKTPREAFISGLLFGLGYFGIGVSWVHISINVYGQAPLWLAVFLTALLVVYLALFMALPGFIYKKYFPENDWRRDLTLLPTLLALSEWVRSWFLTGFPWLAVGYSQIDSWLRGIAPIFGVYGVSFAVAFAAAAICYFFYCQRA